MVCGQNRFSSRPAPEAKSKIGAAGSVWKGGQGSETGKRDREADGDLDKKPPEQSKLAPAWNKRSKSISQESAPHPPSAASPAQRVAAESEEILTRVQFSAQPETERW